MNGNARCDGFITSLALFLFTSNQLYESIRATSFDKSKKKKKKECTRHQTINKNVEIENANIDRFCIYNKNDKDI